MNGEIAGNSIQKLSHRISCPQLVFSIWRFLFILFFCYVNSTFYCSKKCLKSWITDLFLIKLLFFAAFFCVLFRLKTGSLNHKLCALWLSAGMLNDDQNSILHCGFEGFVNYVTIYSKPWMRKVRTSSRHLLAEIRAIHGTWYTSTFF